MNSESKLSLRDDDWVEESLLLDSEAQKLQAQRNEMQ
jgi:hypothetical protein